MINNFKEEFLKRLMRDTELKNAMLEDLKKGLDKEQLNTLMKIEDGLKSCLKARRDYIYAKAFNQGLKNGIIPLNEEKLFCYDEEGNSRFVPEIEKKIADIAEKVETDRKFVSKYDKVEKYLSILKNSLPDEENKLLASRYEDAWWYMYVSLDDLIYFNGVTDSMDLVSVVLGKYKNSSGRRNTALKTEELIPVFSY